MADDTANNETPLVERWLQEQQQWQRTALAYLDSMVKNDDFLVHLGNAMRGSLLAGKPYPTAPPPEGSAPETPADDRFDQVLFALHQLEGQIQDLRMTLEEMRDGRLGPSRAEPAARKSPKPARKKAARTQPARAKRASAGRPAKARKRTPKRQARR